MVLALVCKPMSVSYATDSLKNIIEPIAGMKHEEVRRRHRPSRYVRELRRVHQITPWHWTQAFGIR